MWIRRWIAGSAAAAAAPAGSADGDPAYDMFLDSIVTEMRLERQVREIRDEYRRELDAAQECAAAAADPLEGAPSSRVWLLTVAQVAILALLLVLVAATWWKVTQVMQVKQVTQQLTTTHNNVNIAVPQSVGARFGHALGSYARYAARAADNNNNNKVDQAPKLDLVGALAAAAPEPRAVASTPLKRAESFPDHISDISSADLEDIDVDAAAVQFDAYESQGESKGESKGEYPKTQVKPTSPAHETRSMSPQKCGVSPGAAKRKPSPARSPAQKAVKPWKF